MFGCFSVYFEDKLLLFVKENQKDPKFNGVYVAIKEGYREQTIHKLQIKDLNKTKDDHEFFYSDAWIPISTDEPNFETIVRLACELILKNDEGIGRIPKKKYTKLKNKRT